MSLTTTSAKLTGSPGKSGWAQVHEFFPEDEEKAKLRGRLFAVISIPRQKSDESRDSQAIEEVAVGREILTRLHEEYFGNTQISAFNAIKRAVEKVVEEFEGSAFGIEIAAAAFVNDVLYVAVGGGGQAAVFREGALARILVSKKGQTVSASGRPKEDDVFILATSHLFKDLSGGSVKASLENTGLEDAIESLAPAVHTREDMGNLGMVFIKFGPEKDFLPAFSKNDVEPAKELREKTVFIPKQNLLLRIERLRERFSSFSSRFFPERRIYIKRKTDVVTSQNRRTAVLVGTILTVLLVVSIGFGIKQKRAIEEKSRYSERLGRAKNELEEAEKLFSLNPTKARELLVDSRRLVNEMKEEGIKDEEIEKLATAIKEREEEILGEYKVSPELFLDLSILTNDFKGDEIVASDDRAFVLDKNGKRVVAIDLDTKRTEVVSSPDKTGEAKNLATFADRIFVVGNDGVYEVGEKRRKVVDKIWEGEVLLNAYAGNLYLLDRGTSQIWRFVGLADGFSSGQRWLAPGVEPDLTNIFSWTIDGSIWLLSRTGGVFKFTRGNQESLELKGVSPSITNPLSIYTNKDLAGVYLLEKDRGRVVVLDKDGEYRAQYLDEKLKEANSLVVSEKVGKMVLLAGPKLYSIELRHLR